MPTLSGGDKLDAILKELKGKVTKTAELQVGFFEGSTEPDGTSLPMVAAINEYGAPSRGQPPRPFFRTAIAKNSHKWGPNLAVALKNNDNDSTKALAQLGTEIRDEIKESINELFDPPLSPVTIMLRGMKSQGVKITGKQVGIAAARVAAGKTNYGASTKPLIDSATMVDKVDFIVK